MINAGFRMLTELFKGYCTTKALKKSLSNTTTESSNTTIPNSNMRGQIDSAELISCLRQGMAAARLIEDYFAFARSIGCTVIRDEIHCTEGEALLLMQWWRAHTIKSSSDGGFL